MSAILDPLYGILKIQFEIRNQWPKNPWVQSYAKIVEFPKFHVHHIEPAISKNEKPMSNS